MSSDIDKVAEELRRRGVLQIRKNNVGRHLNQVQCKHLQKQYVQAVSQWLDLYRSHYMAHYTMTVAPYYMAMGYAQAACQFMVSQSGSGNVININSGANPLSGTPQPNQAASVGNAQNGGRVLAVNSPFILFFAELIDFVLLFSIKLTITMYAILYFGIVDQTSFALKFLAEEIDEDATMDDLQQVLGIAVIYRSFVCIYEVHDISCEYYRRATLGGATPGKFLMGLRTISCERVQTIAPRRVQVTLPDNLTYTQAFGRAVIKNFSMAFFFPACITIFFNPHLRSTYDIITKTMVVSVSQDFPNDVNNNRNPGRSELDEANRRDIHDSCKLIVRMRLFLLFHVIALTLD
ncbi:hypothetical protein BSL78_23755 [Apostichopus japonicus]|uniref:RDD domain-containing protein n=1 Tax=Stichopus japonicus TaxID=307972 RepID=A0A2G8JUI5_STIJA|nr:hypothetical protein BSL78_23755 [Apostichopus japonicus]